MLVDTQRLVAPGGLGSNSNIFVCEPLLSNMKNVEKNLFALCGLKRKRCGGPLFVEARICNVIERKFSSKYIFEINLTLL